MNRQGNHETEICAIWYAIDCLRDPKNTPFAEIREGRCYCEHCCSYRYHQEQENENLTRVVCAWVVLTICFGAFLCALFIR